MGTFLKTFFICLIITLSFLVYKCFYSNGFSPELEISKNSPIFGTHKDIEEVKNKNKEDENDIQPPQEEQQNLSDTQPSKPDKKKEIKYKHTCYFYSAKGELVPVSRELETKPTLESIILVLLKGPIISETQKGMYSEIPANVDLIYVKNLDNKIIVNLTSNFGNGGGSQSVENRVKQLSKTIKNFSPKKKIYLYINGKEVEYLGGEGVYIKQPL